MKWDILSIPLITESGGESDGLQYGNSFEKEERVVGGAGVGGAGVGGAGVGGAGVGGAGVSGAEVGGAGVIDHARIRYPTLPSTVHLEEFQLQSTV
ncbi:hypothetical protein FHG87_012979 [Trinorchestia longiramus]|nr:hypothetical protein FHG87_012979 [Trinorchestia longiramus]